MVREPRGYRAYTVVVKKKATNFITMKARRRLVYNFYNDLLSNLQTFSVGNAGFETGHLQDQAIAALQPHIPIKKINIRSLPSCQINLIVPTRPVLNQNVDILTQNVRNRLQLRNKRSVKGVHGLHATNIKHGLASQK